MRRLHDDDDDEQATFASKLSQSIAARKCAQSARYLGKLSKTKSNNSLAARKANLAAMASPARRLVIYQFFLVCFGDRNGCASTIAIAAAAAATRATDHRGEQLVSI